MSRRLTSKIIVRLLAILLIGIVSTLAVWVAAAGPITVYRIVRHGDTQIDDFRYYPARQLQASSAPFLFDEYSGGSRVPGSVEREDGIRIPLDDLLQSNDTIAFLVIKDDTLLFEKYFQGHTQSSLSQSFSMAKSFTSLLIGMAIEDGYIQSVEQPVTDFIPELVDRGFSNVLIRHLLAMTSGSDYVEDDNPFKIHVILNYTPQLEKEILGFGMQDEPGKVWRYKSGDNALLALILDRALGEKTITDYTQVRLWTPLGMEYQGMWTLDHAGDGLEKTWCCLAASARDFAKLGRLVLKDGRWGGQELVSVGWVHQSTQVGAVPEAGWPADYKAIGVRNYGYQWWLLSAQEGDYFANGKDGQLLYINPAQNLIILRLGWSTGEMRLSQWLSLFKFLSRQVN